MGFPEEVMLLCRDMKNAQESARVDDLEDAPGRGNDICKGSEVRVAKERPV